jgi:hypothetical protein
MRELTARSDTNAKLSDVINNCAGNGTTRRYIRITAFFSVGLSYLAYATSSLFGAPNMKSIPVRTVWIAGLQGE